ncbi:type I restriction endonuclease subunit R [Anaerolineales bacterium HSG25]|nr:type I restriction endonuclease subunit R [Anaerolineales bacterium HSG25]
MSHRTGTEADFEQETIDRLGQLGYPHQPGGQCQRAPHEVLLLDELRTYLSRRYKTLPPQAIDKAIDTIRTPSGIDTLQRNMAFQQMFRNGITVSYEQSLTPQTNNPQATYPQADNPQATYPQATYPQADSLRVGEQADSLRVGEQGEPKEAHLYLANFESPELNRWLVVNQLAIQGAKVQGEGNDRRPDVIIYLNGLPLILFELKSPKDAYVDVGGAYNQIQHYSHDIPRLFEFNCFCVVADGTHARHGPHTASFEWFSAWESIDGHHRAPLTISSLRVLFEGLFPKERLLTYLRHYIVHEQDEGKITKKAAKYHQFFAVQIAVERSLNAMQSPSQGEGELASPPLATGGRIEEGPLAKGDKRVGVVWHTQGSGKSLEMVFLVGILRQHQNFNPTCLIQVDRANLDTQLYDHFVAAKALVGSVEQAEGVDHLRELFTEPGRVVCSTIEKFALKDGETKHPPLYSDHDLLVIADEAHRTQYGKSTKAEKQEDGSTKTSQGYALSLRQAFPNASFIAFTGTPIDQQDRDTQQIFGQIIHSYDMEQATQDGAVVPIFYEARHIPLKLDNDRIDEKWDGLTEEYEVPPEQSELLKKEFSTIQELAIDKQRVAIVGRHIVKHFNKRTGRGGVAGKGMVACMSREHCVRLYEAMTVLEDCPETKIVMTGKQAKDKPQWSEAGYITTKHQRQKIKARFIDPDDPLKIVIVCDMWLTGFDAPPLHTMYIDKTLKGHNLMQGIARVNRVFKDKPNGLIVDMLGIGDQLKIATKKYTQSGGKGELTESLRDKAVTYFKEQLARVRALMPRADHLPASSELAGRSGHLPASSKLAGRSGHLPASSKLAGRSGHLPASSKLAGRSGHLPASSKLAGSSLAGSLIYSQWRALTPIQLGDLLALCYGIFTPNQSLRDDYLTQEHRLSKAHSLIQHLPIVKPHSDEVQFYQMVRQQLRRLKPKIRKSVEDMKQAVRDLLDESIEAGNMVDIFTTAGLEQPSINILDRQFLDEFADQPHQDLKARLLYKLLNDELHYREHENIVQYRSFKEMLEQAITRYNNRETPAHKLVQTMLDIREEQAKLEKRKTDLGLNTEQMAFHDTLAKHLAVDEAILTELAKDIVTLLHNTLEVDWTKPHRKDISAKVQQGLRPILRNYVDRTTRKTVRQAIMDQVTANYKDWPEIASNKQDTSSVDNAPNKASRQEQANDLNSAVDRLEIKFRDFIDYYLTLKVGPDYWHQTAPSIIIPGVEKHIKKHLDSHPYENPADYESGRKHLDYCTVGQYEQIIVKKKNWALFEAVFKDKNNFQKHFGNYRELRNAIKHSRKPSDVERKHGEGSMIWLEKTLAQYDDAILAAKAETK